MCLPLRSVRRQRRGALYAFYIQEYAALNHSMLVRGMKRVAVAQGGAVSGGECAQNVHIQALAVFPFQCSPAIHASWPSAPDAWRPKRRRQFSRACSGAHPVTLSHDK